MITNIEFYLYITWYIPLQTFNKINASLPKLMSGNQINWVEKKSHNSIKSLQMITDIEFDPYFTMMYPSANFQ